MRRKLLTIKVLYSTDNFYYIPTISGFVGLKQYKYYTFFSLSFLFITIEITRCRLINYDFHVLYLFNEDHKLLLPSKK